jgi:hypothetical protein
MNNDTTKRTETNVSQISSYERPKFSTQKYGGCTAHTVCLPVRLRHGYLLHGYLLHGYLLHGYLLNSRDSCTIIVKWWVGSNVEETAVRSGAP